MITRIRMEAHMGRFRRKITRHAEILIINGSGPRAWTAGIYGARALRRDVLLVVTGHPAGGQLEPSNHGCREFYRGLYRESQARELHACQGCRPMRGAMGPPRWPTNHIASVRLFWDVRPLPAPSARAATFILPDFHCPISTGRRAQMGSNLSPPSKKFSRGLRPLSACATCGTGLLLYAGRGRLWWFGRRQIFLPLSKGKRPLFP